MAVKEVTVRYLCELTGMSVDALSHKIGFHTTHAYRLLREGTDLLTSTKARQVLAVLEEFDDNPYTVKTILRKKAER